MRSTSGTSDSSEFGIPLPRDYRCASRRPPLAESGHVSRMRPVEPLWTLWKKGCPGPGCGGVMRRGGMLGALASNGSGEPRHQLAEVCLRGGEAFPSGTAGSAGTQLVASGWGSAILLPIRLVRIWCRIIHSYPLIMRLLQDSKARWNDPVRG